MKVLLDATAVTQHPSGVRSRILGLYPLLAAHASVRLTAVVRTDGGLAHPFREAGAEVVEVDRGPPRWARWFRALHGPARRAAKGAGYDLFAAETLPLPGPGKAAVAATVHDLRFLEPGLASPLRRKLLTGLFQRNILRADGVITVSRFMKEEILRTCPALPEDRIRVVPNAAPNLPAVTPEEGKALLREHGVSPPYLLCIGHQEPRKNISTLLEAYRIFRKGSLRTAAMGLVVAGGGAAALRGPLTRRPDDRGAAGGHPGRRSGPLFLGRVSDRVRAALLRSARLVVQPSRYEGFGMGVLEALALGVPVACSGIPAHREVAGEGARYFAPDSAEEMAEAMAEAALDEDARARRVAEGRERAKGFSWTRSAAKLLEAWEGCLAGGAGKPNRPRRRPPGRPPD